MTRLGVAAAVVALAGAVAEPPRSVLVLDYKTQELLALDGATGEIRQRLSMPVGTIYEPRNSSRLVVFAASARGLGIELASIVEREPVRLVTAGISLGKFCYPHAASESEDGTQLTFPCSGRVTRLNLATGVAEYLDAGGEAYGPYRIPPGRNAVLQVNRRPGCDVIFFEFSSLRVIEKTSFEGYCSLSPVLVRDPRTVVLLLDQSQYTDKPESELLHFDAETGALSRRVRLPQPYGWGQASSDGRYVYRLLTRDSRRREIATPSLQVLSSADGSVVAEKPVSPDAFLTSMRWNGAPNMDRPNQLLIDNPTRKGATTLNVLDGARMLTFPIPDRTEVVVRHDAQHHRMLVPAGRALWVLSESFERLNEVPLGRSASGGFLVGDDPRRLLWIRGDKVQVLDLETRSLTPEAGIGTGGRKAVQLLGELGGSFISGVPVDFDAATTAVFSTDSKRAWVLAPTGQISTVDLASGKVLAHRDGGAFMVSTRHLFVALTRSSARVFDRRIGQAIQTHTLDVQLNDEPFVKQSGDGTRVLIGGGKVVILLDGQTGKAIFATKGFGDVSGAYFMN